MQGMTEVFRLTPEPGKYYSYAEHTKCVGKWPNVKYYTTNKLQYVGLFLYHSVSGYRDNAEHVSTFYNCGKETRIRYSDGGNTSFIEVKPRINPTLKSELIEYHKHKKPPTLQFWR